MDVKTVFLNSDLEDSIYMMQPGEFIAKGQEHLVCKLHKSIYGLKVTVFSQDLVIYSVLDERYRHGVPLSQDQCPKLTEEKDFMKDNTLCFYGDGAVSWRSVKQSCIVDSTMEVDGAMAQSKEPINHQKGKHIERKYHMIREIGCEKMCLWRRLLLMRTWRILL
ncbi:hypothetical protein CK203_117718 [Vitis vinifera]|uniref:Reverse transcriptase Ty1/copia-type domain-containing protein n=1 Tax=Vitis vinifera TaxID=29760 RepID=A0A438CUB2_VITVI|nr:hypothetical protein CK203_117718 [Vitis vinifera]